MTPRRKLARLVPETVQTSAMDCGPACLKSLLQGFGVDVSYGRLREACQTDVDGTSIDTLEVVANQLGLNADQIMLPVDHVLLDEADALPAIIIIQLPNGFTHFVVAWRQHGGRLVQVMDPAQGRRWLTPQQFRDELFVHRFPVAADGWREWAGSDEFVLPLRRRLAQLSLSALDCESLIVTARADAGWHSIATLDAATRMTAALVDAGGIRKGAEATRTVYALVRDSAEMLNHIPEAYWSAYPLPIDDAEEQNLLLRGAVLVRVNSVKAVDSDALTQVSPELMAALNETPLPPGQRLLHMLRADGLLTPLTLIVAVLLASLTKFVEALLFRGLLDVNSLLATSGQRQAAFAAILIFIFVAILLQILIDINVFRIGRRLETRLRIAFLTKVPRLTDRYFHSRPISDMADRAHSVHRLRNLPEYGQRFLNGFFQLLLSVLGMAWIYPRMAVVIILSALFASAVPLLLQPVMTELDLRVRTHVGALTRFNLDALLGLVPIHTHRAQRSISREHESLLAEWVHASVRFLRWHTTIEGMQIVVVMVGVCWVIVDYVLRSGETGGVLLLSYWGLTIPYWGRDIVYAVREYAKEHNIALRLFEPLGAIEEAHLDLADGSVERELSSAEIGVDIRMEAVNVVAAGNTLLGNVNLHIAAGEQVAIVGASGAGKTSLVSLLLGWHRAAAGHVLIDGQPLDPTTRQQLYDQTAWVDPAVQLWNRSLLDNLHYGNQHTMMPLSQLIDQADLRAVLEKLPDGLQTPLGESGGLVSGGEGQRIRLGRALLRPNVRLVVLDEAFRGLGRSQRHELLQKARQHWAEATLLCVTHDVAETKLFDRVLVVDNGQIVEDGSPQALLAQADSHFRALLLGEERVQTELWNNPLWRKFWMQDGQLEETGQATGESA